MPYLQNLDLVPVRGRYVRKGQLESCPMTPDSSSLSDRICEANDCTDPLLAKGLCSYHYYRQARGVPLDAPKRAMGANFTGCCTVQECAQPPRSKHADYCAKHYSRWRRYGDPGMVSKPLNPTGKCQVDGCDRPPARRTMQYCDMHYRRARKHGDPHEVLKRGPKAGENHPSWRGNQIGYPAAHQRLRRVRGGPGACEHCGGHSNDETVLHWALNWETAKTLVWDADLRMHFSVDPNDYLSLCAMCHKKFDLRRFEGE